MTDCKKCGLPLPINGPLRKVICNHCLNEIKLELIKWTEQVAWTAMRGGNLLRLSSYDCTGIKTKQYLCSICPKCESEIHFNTELLGKDTVISCPECAEEIETFPAPDWLKEELNMVVQVISTARESRVPQNASILKTDQKAVKPILFLCPGCGATLKVLSETSRLMPCGHCNSEVYLPDIIWKRLHPISIVIPWTIIYEGRKVFNKKCPSADLLM
jgi:protein-arginine kinase activator protein McsA